MPSAQSPYPDPRWVLVLISLLLALMTAATAWLLSVDDPAALKQLIEDSGPVQMVGQICIALAFCCAFFYGLADKKRRGSYLPLAYLLLFYTLREADYHYKVSEYAKATQIKRFYSHELIPLSTKLMMASLIILFLVVLWRYLRREKDGYLRALWEKLPWAVFAFLWAGTFALSQVVDQLPMFHNVTGQVFEEILESSAEIIALVALILFRIQLWGDARAQATAA